MAKRNTSQNAPQTLHSPDTGEEGAGMGLPVDIVGRVEITDGKRARGFLTAVKSADQARLDAKSRLLGTASQRLAEVRDLLKKAGGVSEEATGIINEVGVALYQGLARKVLSADDMNNLLGNQFGFRKKGDAKVTVPAGHKDASKTPAGTGEGIRKRIVRAAQAFDYVMNNAETAFFEGLPEADVQAVIDNLPHPGENGEWIAPEGGISLWRAYDWLTEIKRDNAAGAVDLAFNFRRIAAINDKLEADIAASVRLFKDTPGLTEAYAALMNTLAAIDEAGADEAEALEAYATLAAEKAGGDEVLAA